MGAARYTPCSQPKASVTSGTVVLRLPPTTMAVRGTPWGLSTRLESAGLLYCEAVKRLFGCAAFPAPGDQGLPCQSTSPSGTGPSLPSHQTVPSGARATFV